VATPFRSNTRSEECGTSCFSGYIKNLFTSTAYQARFDKTQWIKKRRFYLFKAKIPQDKWVQNETRNFRWSTNYTTIRRPRLTRSTELNSTKRRAWKAFENVCRNFLGIENDKLQWNYAGANFVMGCIWIVYWNFIFCIPIWNFFPENMGAVSSEDGERLHRDISGMEKGYSGKWMPNMLADNWWIHIRETPTSSRI
jgi:hypothetical protein